MDFFLGGYRLKVNAPELFADHPTIAKFSNPTLATVLPDSEIQLEIFSGDLPSPHYARWRENAPRVDTGSTWALAVHENTEFPYQLAPSPGAEFHARSLHLLASENFRQLRLYRGQWRNQSPGTWLFYPYEQTVFIHLLQFSGEAALVHASAVEIGGKGYLFLGDSGAGKSTISRHLENELGGGQIFSDDRIIVRHHGGKWWMFGTPWHGEFARTRAEGVEIGGMFFLEKAAEHKLTRLDPAAGTARLLPVVFGAWWLPQRLGTYLRFVHRLAAQNQFPLHRLDFANHPSVVSFLLRSLHAEQ